jgi:hypothetical protein
MAFFRSSKEGGKTMPARERMKEAAKKKRGRPRKDSAHVGEDGQEPISEFRRDPADATDEDTVVEKRGSRKTQARLPGQERKTDKEVEKLALDLYATQSERLALQQSEKEKRALLHDRMKAKEITRQVLPGGLVAELKQSEEKALVHKADDAEADEA